MEVTSVRHAAVQLGREPELLKEQLEERRRQFARFANGQRRRGSTANLFFGQPEWVQVEYNRIYEERLARLPRAPK